jgi:hypothetical protein
MHEHEHHHHHHDHEVNSSDEAAAMLAYMVHHNEHHIEELADIAAKLPEEVRAKITEAAEIMKKGNALLREAAEQVK